MYVLIWGCVLLVMLYIYLNKKHAYFKNHDINHLPPVLIFGNIIKPILRVRHFVENMNELYFAFPDDRFVGNYDFINPTVMIRDPELLRLIGVKDFDYFSDHRTFTSKKDPVFAKSLFGLKGQKWRDMRSTLSPAFTGSKLRGMVPLIQDCSKNLVRYLESEIKKNDDGYIDIDSKDLFTRYANDVIATCAFGLRVDSIAEKDNEFYRMGHKFTNFTYTQILKMFTILVFPFVNQIIDMEIFPKDVIGFLKHIVLDTMKNRDENNIFRPDVIQILLEVKKGILKHEKVKDDKDAGFATVEESDIGKSAVKQVWNDEDLVAQAVLFFLAGFDTVSTAMVFLMYELAVNGDVQARLRREVDDYYEKYQGKVDYEKLNQMKYLDMVLSESLRKWPPAPNLDRECQKHYNLGKPHDKATKDFHLEKGSQVIVPVWAIHQDPRYYTEPARFDPERFSDDNRHNIKPFTYMPFGVGPRNCIGSRFALTEVKSMVFDLLRHFELSPATKTKIPPQLDPSTFAIRMLGGHWKMIIYIWLCVPLVAFWLYLRKTYAYFKERGVNHLPPVPVFGNMARPIFRKEHAIHNLSRLYSSFPEDRFIGVYEFVNKLTVIRDPELLRTIGVKDFDCFTDHRLFSGKDDPLFAKSLFGLTGQKWRDMRSTLSPAFTGSKLRGMVPLIQDCTKNLVRQLNEDMKKSEGGYLDLDSKDLFTRYANDVIATCVFGLQINSVAEKNNLFHAMGVKMTKFGFIQLLKMFIMIIFPFIHKFVEISMFSKNAIDYFSKIVLQTMRDREENNVNRPDLIQILLEAKKGTLTHENVKDEKDAGFATVEESSIGKRVVRRAWDDDHLVAQAILFFFGGFETVSTTMVYLIYELAVNPDVQFKLRQEIDKCYKENQGQIDYETINRMKYLDMVLSESLRKWPPLPAIDRICQKRYNLGKPHDKATKEYYLEKGSIVFIPIWPIHYDPRYYPEPMRFNPERFSDDNKHNIRPFTYMPFGIGPRNCIGSRFAITEVKAMVFELLRNFEVTPGPKTRVPAELDPSNFAVRLLGGNYIRIKPRNSSVL